MGFPLTSLGRTLGRDSPSRPNGVISVGSETPELCLRVSSLPSSRPSGEEKGRERSQSNPAECILRTHGLPEKAMSVLSGQRDSGPKK